MRPVLGPFVAAKAVGIGVLLLTVWQSSTTRGGATWDELRGPFAAWDAQSYASIADHGYPHGPLDLVPGHAGHLWGFFPGFPLLLRAVHLVVPDIVVAGVLLNSALELVALVLVVRLVAGEAGPEAGALSGWLVALYPYAIFLTILYTESAFLAAATGCLLYVRRGDTPRAALCAALAMSVRVTGLALIPAMLLALVTRRSRGAVRDAACIVLSLTPIVLFAVWAKLATGDALAYLHVQDSASFGNRVGTWPWSALQRTWEIATDPGGTSSNRSTFTLEVVWGLAGYAVVAALWLSRRVARDLALYATGVLLLSTAESYWLGVPRYLLALLPVALVLLAPPLSRRPQLARAAVVVSACLMAYGASVIASGRFLA